MKKAIYIIIIFVFAFVLLLTVIGEDLNLDSKQIDNIVKLVPPLFTALTLMVTLSLYDRFGRKKLVYDKQLNTVLEYIHTIRQMPMYYTLNNIVHFSNGKSGGAHGHYKMYISQNMKEARAFATMYGHLPVYFLDDAREELDKFDSFFNSLYMPKSLQRFPIRNNNLINIHEFNDSHVLISFNYKPDYNIEREKLRRLVYYKINFIDFITEIEETIKTSKKWLEEKTDLKDDLNFD